MIRSGLRFVTVFCLVGLMAVTSLAQDAKKTEPASAKASSPPESTHKVRRDRLKVEVNLTGTFEAVNTWPVALSPETWSSFTVVEAVAHGQKVQQGDTLVELDMSQIDQQLQDLEKEMKLKQLSRRVADTEWELLQKSAELDLEAAERTKRIANEELEYFQETDRAFQIEAAKQSLKSARDSLSYAEEELRQLEKMYTADDLTEETEEIVLKRARDQVERARFALKSTQLRTERTLDKSIPREARQLREAARRAEISWTKSKETMPAQLEQKQIELEKQHVETKRLQEKLEKLRQDRDMMRVKAPADGYVYYGTWKRGAWSGLESVAAKLTEGGTLSPHSVFMTVVSPRPLRVRAKVPEDKLHHLSRGAQGTAVPKGYPELELTASLRHLSPLPMANGTFDGQFQVILSDEAEDIVPAMNCELTLVVYDKKDAIAVPAKAVFEDRVDGKRDVVYVKRPEGDPEKRKVVIGHKTEEKWEIVRGLKAGEEILLNKPDAS